MSETNQWGTARKPHNGYLGYVAERKVLHSIGGHIVIIDRDKGGDWIGSEERWVLIWEPLPGSAALERFGARIMECDTRANAFSLMKCAAVEPEDFCFVDLDEMEGGE